MNFLLPYILIIIIISIYTCNVCAIFKDIEFGSPLMQKEFLLEYKNFNHGSFGNCPKKVLDIQQKLRIRQEAMPDVWFRDDYKKLINETIEILSKVINVKSKDLVLIENASSGINSLLRSFLNWKKGDIVILFSTAYDMVKHTAVWLQETQGVKVVQVNISFPIEEGDAENAFTKPLEFFLQNLNEKEREKVRVVLLDHIVSVPAIIQPVKKLTEIIKFYAKDAQVFVDGAHALGQVESLDLQKLGRIDAYLSNGHKWLFSAKGSAFLWVNPEIQTLNFPEPTVISSENKPSSTPLWERFMYTGTRDYTSFLTIPYAIEFRNELGGDKKIFNYCHNLAINAGDYLAKLWNTSLMAPSSIHSMMINIVLPTKDFEKAKAMQIKLLNEHKIYMIVLQEPFSKIVYTRLSAQVYLNLNDFKELGYIIKKYLMESSISLKI